MTVAIVGTPAVAQDSINYIAEAGSNRALVVTVPYQPGAVTGANVSLGGASFNRAHRVGGFANGEAEVHYLLEADIPSGTSTLTITYDGGSPTSAGYGLIYTLENVDQSVPVGDVSGTAGFLSSHDSGPLSVLPGDFVALAGFQNTDIATETFPSGYTVLQSALFSGRERYAASKQVSAGGTESATFAFSQNINSAVTWVVFKASSVSVSGYRLWVAPGDPNNQLSSSGTNGQSTTFFADFETPAAGDIGTDSPGHIVGRLWDRLRVVKDIAGDMFLSARFDVANNPSAGEVFIAVQPETRYCAAVTFDTTNGVNLYVSTYANNATNPEGMGTQNTFNSDDNRFRYGSRQGTAAPVEPFVGKIYAGAYWTRVLTQAELEALLDSGQSPEVAAATDLLRYHDLSDGDLLADGGTTGDLTLSGTVDFVLDPLAITNVPNMTQGVQATITGTTFGATGGTLEYGLTKLGPWTAHAVDTWADTSIIITPDLPYNGTYLWRVTTTTPESVIGGPNTVSGVPIPSTTPPTPELIEFVEGSNTGYSNSADDVFTLTTAPQEGDLVFIFTRSTDTPSVDFGVPTGFEPWTHIDSWSYDLAYTYKIAGSQEPTTYTVTALNTNSTALTGGLYVFRGVDTTTPFGTFNNNYTSATWTGLEPLSFTSLEGGAAVGMFTGVINPSGTHIAPPFIKDGTSFRAVWASATGFSAGTQEFILDPNNEAISSRHYAVVPINPAPAPAAVLEITNVPNMTQGVEATITGTGFGAGGPTAGTLEYGTTSQGPWTAHVVDTWADTSIIITPNLPVSGEYYWRVTNNDLEEGVGGPNTVQTTAELIIGINDTFLTSSAGIGTGQSQELLVNTSLTEVLPAASRLTQVGMAIAAADGDETIKIGVYALANAEAPADAAGAELIAETVLSIPIVAANQWVTKDVDIDLSAHTGKRVAIAFGSPSSGITIRYSNTTSYGDPSISTATSSGYDLPAIWSHASYASQVIAYYGTITYDLNPPPGAVINAILGLASSSNLVSAKQAVFNSAIELAKINALDTVSFVEFTGPNITSIPSPLTVGQTGVSIIGTGFGA